MSDFSPTDFSMTRKLEKMEGGCRREQQDKRKEYSLLGLHFISCFLSSSSLSF